jgi:hypothetical protein
MKLSVVIPVHKRRGGHRHKPQYPLRTAPPNGEWRDPRCASNYPFIHIEVKRRPLFIISERYNFGEEGMGIVDVKEGEPKER